MRTGAAPATGDRRSARSARRSSSSGSGGGLVAASDSVTASAARCHHVAASAEGVERPLQHPALTEVGILAGFVVRERMPAMPRRSR